MPAFSTSYRVYSIMYSKRTEQKKTWCSRYKRPEKEKVFNVFNQECIHKGQIQIIFGTCYVQIGKFLAFTILLHDTYEI